MSPRVGLATQTLTYVNRNSAASELPLLAILALYKPRTLDRAPFKMPSSDDSCEGRHTHPGALSDRCYPRDGMRTTDYHTVHMTD